MDWSLLRPRDREDVEASLSAMLVIAAVALWAAERRGRKDMLLFQVFVFIVLPFFDDMCLNSVTIRGALTRD